MKNLIKKFVSTAVLSVVLLPAPFAQAAESSDLLRNVAHATSVEFSADMNVETYASGMNQPVKVHVDLDGISSKTQNSRFDIGASLIDQNGELTTSSGSMILSQDTAYFSQDGKNWYFAKQNGYADSPIVSETEESVAEMQAAFQNMLDRGIVQYQFDAMDTVNAKPAARFVYSVNTDRVVEYFVETQMVSSSDAETVRAYLAEHVTMNGSFWVDTAEMLPAMFTLNVNVHQTDASYTLVNLSVRFKKFNVPVNIALPTNATDIKNYHLSKDDEAAIEHLGSAFGAVDADGDGVTNADEEEVWHSNPLSSDTDGDGYPDYTEVINGYDPNGVGKLDSDGDGLTDYAEMTVHWTDRFDADSDNDGYNDGLEIANGYNPNGPGRW